MSKRTEKGKFFTVEQMEVGSSESRGQYSCLVQQAANQIAEDFDGVTANGKANIRDLAW